MVGFCSMKLASGVAATNITVIATITAMYMIASSSVMPTAVMIESTEKTRSSSRIWKIAPPRVRFSVWPTISSLWSCGSTEWWISLVAFQTRKRPPAIRIRSRQEKPCPKAVKTGWVSPTMKEMVASRTSRMRSAAEMPRRRALTRCSGGSLLVRIEMKMRLSMPSTTSIAISVTMAAHPAGLVRKAKCGARASRMGIDGSLSSGTAHSACRRRTRVSGATTS